MNKTWSLHLKGSEPTEAEAYICLVGFLFYFVLYKNPTLSQMIMIKELTYGLHFLPETFQALFHFNSHKV